MRSKVLLKLAILHELEGWWQLIGHIHKVEELHITIFKCFGRPFG